MKKFSTILLLIFALSVSVFGQSRDVEIDAEWGKICGTLATPEEGASTAVVIVAGSGPTDRNGNSGLNLNTYCYKMLSDALAEEGYAVLRYDKRGIGMSQAPTEVILSAVFDHFVDDAALCVDYLRDAGYDKVVMVGHSEGGEIALALASRDTTALDGIVLLSAAGYTMETILMRQLSAQLMPNYMGLMLSATNILQSLKRGQDVAEDRIPKELISLFHPAVQPYLRSYLTLDPADLIAKVEQRVLIISGGRDIQVSVDNAERLLESAKRGQHISFADMSHILKDTTTDDRIEQMLSVYTNAQLPLTEGLVAAIVDYLKTL